MKGERIRRLSIVSRVNSINEDGEMGSCAAAGSDVEDELRSTSRISKRFKLPRKFFYDCNTVDHASVPRKLRSAMKKRNRESISPPLPDKKPNHGINGVELPRKNGIKKSRLNQGDSEGSPSRPINGSITKDEEEVVETLYALADMFPSSNEKNGSDGELTEAKSWPLPNGESSMPAFEAPEKEKDSKSLRPSNTPEEESVEGSAQVIVEIKHPNVPSQHSFPKGIQFHAESDDAISHRNVQAVCQPELSLKIGSKQLKHEEAAACPRKPEIEIGPVSFAAAVSGQHELQYILKESKNSGSTLWPGLSSAGSRSVGSPRPSLQSSSDMIPTWLGTAASATPPGALDKGRFGEKDFRDPVDRKKSWKRCSAHVYISRLIKVMQIAEKTDRSHTQPTQLTPNEGSKQGVLLTAEKLNGVRNGFNGSVSAPNEVRNGMLLHKRLLLDQQQASTPSALYSSQKPSFDFLSLSAGGGGVEARNSSNKEGKWLEPLTHFHLPSPPSLAEPLTHFHLPNPTSLADNHTIMPFSLPENRFSSAPFTYHLPVATAKQVHLQPPPYLGSPLLGSPHLGNAASPKQQQQRWIWTSQLAAQHNPVASHFPNWLNGRQDPSSAIPYAQSQSIPPPSYSSLELLGPKYAPISQQQQLLAVTPPSLHTSKSKRQHHHYLPSGYQGNGVGSYPDAALPPLQLLCTEHL